MTPTVFVVDDETSVRKAIERLLRAAGLSVRTYSSAQDYLHSYDSSAPGCLILDLEMPGISGLDLQREMVAQGGAPAIVFLTGRAEVPDGVRAMKCGAVEFLTKPVTDELLIATVADAIEKDRHDRAQRAALGGIQARFSTLTPRESEVLQHVVAGRLNKQIASDLGTVEKTIKVHRARIMEKMQVKSVAQLVQLAVAAHLTPLPRPQVTRD